MDNLTYFPFFLRALDPSWMYFLLLLIYFFFIQKKKKKRKKKKKKKEKEKEKKKKKKKREEKGSLFPVLRWASHVLNLFYTNNLCHFVWMRTLDVVQIIGMELCSLFTFFVQDSKLSFVFSFIWLHQAIIFYEWGLVFLLVLKLAHLNLGGF